MDANQGWNIPFSSIINVGGGTGFFRFRQQERDIGVVISTSSHIKQFYRTDSHCNSCQISYTRV